MMEIMVKMLEFTHLSIRRKTWECSFSGIFEPRKFYALCGESGSGKSTLFSLLTGLTHPHAGRLTLDARDILGLPPHRRSMSLMTQHNSLFPGVSCEENLRLAWQGSASGFSAKVGEILDLLRLDREFLARNPNDLSGGQLARMNLARALITEARWLLLDEPFAAVDRPTRLSILTGLRDWQSRSNLCIVLIAHDLDDIFPVASDIIVCEDGRITEQSPLKVAMTRPRRVATARTLKNGLIIKKAGKHFFVPANQLKTPHAPDSTTADRSDSHQLERFIQYQHGDVTRVFDFDSQSEFNMIRSGSFSGKVQFNQESLVELTP
jgi:ABC-type sulfate/molybdate transport systems ATPase subunit